MKKIFLLLFPISFSAGAQTTFQPDSTQTLENIIVNAYENNRKLIDVPAPVSLVTARDLNRYNNTGIIESMNAKPGVRMDERSPGSYRLSIRGSSLRSPFGVRNVKVYYDGIPYTDPGGNTFLNQLGFYNFQSIEVIKGPAGSLYGAGTGGVLLIKNNSKEFHPGASVFYNTGSFNLNNLNVNLRFGKEEAHNTINYQHQTSDGYRDHTALRRDVFSWDAVMKKSEKTSIQSHFLYGDMYYQTPGALTKSEYDANAKSARPHAGMSPSADEAKAAFYLKTFLAGISLDQTISTNWKNSTSIYGAYSQNRNPNFRNYSRTSEPHFGGRTVFNYTKDLDKILLTLNAGAEYQQSFNTLRVYNNNAGEVGSLQTDDEIYNQQGFVFLQANADFPHGWSLTAGASVNESNLDFKRFSTTPAESEKRNFKNEIAPRFAILKKINNTFSVYGSVARGFSAPTTAEVLPSTDIFNTTLQAESGVNYEAGTKGNFLRNKLYVDINAFFYRLKNAIVQKRDASGGDYFDNAGSANQNGLESYVSYEVINNARQFFNYGFAYISHTWNNFHYDDYKQTDNDYSGNKLPGVAAQTVAAGFDINTKIGLYANTTFFYSGRIALNDANSAYADPYNLLGLKVGYKTFLSKEIQLELFTGAQNIFDEKYSLGNDINAFGGRYYNVAPGRNFYAGIALQFNKK
jgi:iron complex outermembrane receptor protein